MWNFRPVVMKTSNLNRSFTYQYDGSSRIKSGVYGGGKTGENYTLNNVTYDNNGNIKNLIRSGSRANNTFGIVDNLAYTYNANSNKIQEVKDNSSETASFTDAIGITDYTYNPDGSLKSDANKGINLFEYNYLKLPKKVTFADSRTISYQYSASGKKLKETTSTGDVTDYVGNVIYKNGVVYQITNDEGRVIQNASGGYGYEYDIKDHLGSLRVSFKDSVGIAKTTQENHTGVFGEILTSLIYTNTPKPDNFDYTGHERLKTFNLGYIDAGARWIDPLVPRLIQIDPLAETSRRFSPYIYALNRPTMFTDPDGMEAKGFEYSNGYSTQDSRNETGAVSHEGAFLNAEGGGSDTGKGKQISTGRGGGDNNTPYKVPEHLQASSLQNASISQGKLDNFSREDEAVQLGVNIAGAVEGGYGLTKAVALLKNGLNGLKTLFSFGRSATNIIPEGKLGNHLFKGVDKLLDTPANRQLITQISNEKSLGIDVYGKNWFAKNLSNGKQIYSYSKDGIIKGAGINDEFVDLISRYNLK